jgi:hypothetical protein
MLIVHRASKGQIGSTNIMACAYDGVFMHRRPLYQPS